MRNAELLSLLAGLGMAGQLHAQGAAKVWENYDFVPGSKVIFYTDFTRGQGRQLRARAQVRERARSKWSSATA